MRFRKAITGGLILAVLPLSLAVAAPAQISGVEEAPIQPDTELVYKDEYVLSVSSVPALHGKALEQIQDVTSKPLDITESTSRVMLVEAKESSADSAAGQVAVPYNGARDLCRKLKQAHRAGLRALRVNGNAGFLRPPPACAPNAQVRISKSPNDPYYSYLWGMNQNGPDINAPEAWDLSTGSSSVVVAVIDTGVDYTHEDLVENMWVNSGEVAGNGVDDDGNGVVDDIYGYNSINNTGDPKDDHGHGTHCSGTIGGRGNNGKGVAGVSWQTKIMAVKFLGANGSGSIYNAMKSLDYVTTMKNRGVNLVLSNNSWGGGGYYQPLYDAIRRAKDAGLLFVAAAGNNSNNNDANASYPASYPLENVIAVAAVDSAGNMASFSNYGASSVHLGAPGVSIASSYPGNLYYYMSGTSMAAPHVSGGLALLKAWSPGMDWSSLKARLLSSVKPLSSLSGKTSTGGMMDVYAMLSAGTPVPAPPTATPTRTPTPAPPTATPTPVPTPTMTPTPVPGYWPVTGHVKVDGIGISGAEVRITSEFESRVIYSGPNGAFRFENVRGPGSYTISCFASGHVIGDASAYLPNTKELSCSGTKASYLVRVKVLDEEGNALSGIRIDSGIGGSAETDSNGQVTFSMPYGTNYVLKASSDNTAFNRPELPGTVYGDLDRVFVGSR